MRDCERACERERRRRKEAEAEAEAEAAAGWLAGRAPDSRHAARLPREIDDAEHICAVRAQRARVPPLLLDDVIQPSVGRARARARGGGAGGRVGAGIAHGTRSDVALLLAPSALLVPIDGVPRVRVRMWVRVVRCFARGAPVVERGMRSSRGEINGAGRGGHGDEDCDAHLGWGGLGRGLGRGRVRGRGQRLGSGSRAGRVFWLEGVDAAEPGLGHHDVVFHGVRHRRRGVAGPCAHRHRRRARSGARPRPRRRGGRRGGRRSRGGGMEVGGDGL